jgi:hypothetical protein
MRTREENHQGPFLSEIVACSDWRHLTGLACNARFRNGSSVSGGAWCAASFVIGGWLAVIYSSFVLCPCDWCGAPVAPCGWLGTVQGS